MALADPVRRDLLRRLAAGPARVADLAAPHPISRPAISKHLRILTEVGLTAAQDHGRERHYRLLPGGLAPIADLIDELSPRPPFAESALDGLDLEVRRTVREHVGEQTPRTSPHATEETA